MNEIDWSKAPEGATHYNRTYFDWYKVGSYEPSFWNGRAWAPARFWDDRKHDCIQRPTAPSWSGEGLPPIGVVCEYRVCDGPWYKCEIRYTIKHPAGGVIAYCPHLDHEQALYAPYCQFRPIRTPEQIAAELADQAIKEIAGIICRDGAFDIDDPEVTESAVALYDAGYRKP